MRLNYDTFTGRRSAFVCVAAVLILLTWAANAMYWSSVKISPDVSQTLLAAEKMLSQNGLVVLSVFLAALFTERDRSMKEKFGLEMDPSFSLRFLFPVFVLASLVTYGSQYGLTCLLKAVGHEAKPQSMVDLFRTMKPVTFILFALFPVVVAPIAEELAFRHIMYRFVRMVLYRKEAAVAVSLVFALCHVPLAMMIRTKPFPWEMLVVPVIPLFFLALFLQWQYEKSKSIIPSMLIHAGFNLIAVFLLALEVAYGTPESKQTEPSVPAEQPAVEAPAETEPSDPAEQPVVAVLSWDHNG